MHSIGLLSNLVTVVLKKKKSITTRRYSQSYPFFFYKRWVHSLTPVKRRCCLGAAAPFRCRSPAARRGCCSVCRERERGGQCWGSAELSFPTFPRPCGALGAPHSALRAIEAPLRWLRAGRSVPKALGLFGDVFFHLRVIIPFI